MVIITERCDICGKEKPCVQKYSDFHSNFIEICWLCLKDMKEEIEI